MGQDWKTLSLVGVGAAIVGWVLVRLLTGAPAHHATVPIAAAPSAEHDVAPAAEPTEEHAPSRVAAPPTTTAPEDDGEVAYITRDLEALASALARDQRLEDRLMPRINNALDVPGVLAYRRAPDFWEPAFGGARGGSNR